MSSEDFEPRIIAFLCNWCSYAGADLAGISRIQYPTNVRVIRVMCSGRIDPTFVVRALADGADGVIIGGCHPGDCHYLDGNHRAMRRYHLLMKLLEQFGVEKERVKLAWISAGEGDKFAQVIKEMTETVRKLGPSKRKKSEDGG